MTLVSLYASRELAWGSANGTTAILPLCFGKAANPFFPPFFLFPEVTITTALTNPDGGQAGALATYRDGEKERKNPASTFRANTNGLTPWILSIFL